MLQARRLFAQGLGLVLLGMAAACAPAVTAIAPGGGGIPPATAAVQTSTIPSYPGPAPSATFDATRAYIVSLKTTALAEMNLTETAQPTVTSPPPSPTFPAGAAPCRASDLAIHDNTQGATGTIVIQVQITNAGRTVCYLQGPADIKLADTAGQPVDLVYSTACFLCDNVDALGTALPAATHIAAVQGSLNAKFGLGPGEGLWAILQWNNWCKPFPAGGVKVWLILPEASGVVDGPADILIGGRCDVPGAPSTLVIGEYSRR